MATRAFLTWQSFLLCAASMTLGCTGKAQLTKKLPTAAGIQIRYEEFGEKTSASCLVLLHGASGLAVPLYEQQAEFFGKHGFHVYMPYYFDATHSTNPSFENERKWVDVAETFLLQCRQESLTKRAFLIGFSLGASVALAAGSQGVAMDGIADWYGSLPDEFFSRMRSMPPLLILHGEQDSNIPLINAQQLLRLCDMTTIRCEHHFYHDEGHGFSAAALKDADQRTLSFFASISATPLSQPVSRSTPEIVRPQQILPDSRIFQRSSDGDIR